MKHGDEIYPDICENNHGGDPLSIQAHDSVIESKEQMWARILEYVHRHGPITCDEYEDATGVIHQTASARFSELRRDGKLVPIGKRMTRRGRMAAVLGFPPDRPDLTHATQLSLI